MAVQDELFEVLQRARIAEINGDPNGRAALEAKYGQVWDTQELTSNFRVSGFRAPWVSVTRLADGVKGTLEFQHSPRFYWGFQGLPKWARIVLVF